MFEVNVPKQIFNFVYETLKQSTELNYCNIHAGYYPKGENLIAPSEFPMIILEYGTTSDIESVRTRVFQYEYTLPIVVMTLADKGNFSDLVFNTSGVNQNKGIGDIIFDIKKVLWRNKQGLGINNVIDWNIGDTHNPNITNIQRLLSSLFVRGLQLDLIFKVWENL